MRSKTIKIIGIAVAVAILLAGLAWGLLYSLRCYHCYEYPLGVSHRCNKQLWFALWEYAEKYGGEFPRGQATPEASLSLIGPECAYLLRRREVPEDVVQQMLEHGQLLTPETCGWNYVEGLRVDSDPGLALFWDKEGLDEMGRRLSGDGHIVTFIHADSEHVPESRWSGFLDKQRELLAVDKEKREQSRIKK